MRSVALALIFACGLHQAAPASAKIITFFSMGKKYLLNVPADHEQKQDRPLLVLLHGCKQDAELILRGTKLLEESEKENFLILAPEQSPAVNADHCWNWFLPVNQNRSIQSEAGQIVQVIQNLEAAYGINPKRIYVAGLSAGAALTHILFACYPENFTGFAIHSGLTFQAAQSIDEARGVLLNPSKLDEKKIANQMINCARVPLNKYADKKMLVIHGDQDPRVKARHQAVIVKATQSAIDLLDNGRIDGSTRAQMSTQDISFPNNYSVTQTSYFLGGFLLQSNLVHGLKHAWGGGDLLSENFDPRAPSSTLEILNFFGLKTHTPTTR